MSEAGSQPAGGSMRSIVLYAMAAAFMSVSPLIVFVPVAYISAGLRNGRKGEIGAVAGSVLLLAILASLTSAPGAFPGRFAEILGFLLALGVPSGVVVLMMRRGAEFGHVMMAAMITSLLGLFVTELVMRAAFGISPYGMMLANFHAQSEATIELYRRLGWSEDKLGQMATMAKTFTGSYLVLMLQALVATMFTLSLIMIPRLPVGRITGGTYLLRNLRFPDALLFGFVLGGASPLASGSLRVAGLNLLGITIVLYSLQGLAIVRATLLRVGLGLGGTVIAALIIGLFVPLSLGVLFLLGLFDPFFDFRKMKRKDDSDESHTD